ncbi:MAG: phosphatidate cytidylyltransferase [Oscillospiraceae bacterium]|nr:phosphatidate cytidylyltransferase [Oscillospiraceae bacterium]
MATRVISALVAMVFGAGVLYFSDSIVLNIVLSALSALGLFELLRANKCLQYRFITVISFIYSIAMPFVHMCKDPLIIQTVTVAFVIIMFAGYFFVHKKMNVEKLFYTILIPVFLSYSLNSLYEMHEMSDAGHGVVFILLALCGAWIADTSAYFTGTFFGKHKLCPDISPKKTIEGFAGGLIFTGLFFIAFNVVYVKIFAKTASVNFIPSFFLGMICAAIGTIGDLSASLIKRQCNIKDFGKIMPGHGGFMDRFDSVLFVAPFMKMYLSFFDIFA